jgi:threonine/homoserine/homoserine lactone efflux protein
MTVEFLLVVVAIVIAPGVDFLMVFRNTVMGGRGVGAATIAGVCAASATQGALVAIGVGTFVVQSQWLFQTIKWAGIAYLLYLGVQSLRSALRKKLPPVVQDQAPTEQWARGLRQGFLCNITNPKMFVFYLSLLPQFVGPQATLQDWLVHAWTLPALGAVYLLLVVVLAASLRGRLLRPTIRRVTDTIAGIAFIGFGAKLATSP